MKKLFEKNKRKKLLSLAIVSFLLIGISVYGCSANEKKKAEAQKNAFDDVTIEVKDEYSGTIPLTKESTVLNTKDMVDVLKNGKTDENTKVTKTDTETIDTSKEAEYTVSYTVETLDELGNKATKEYKKTFNVTNTDKIAPVIKLKKETETKSDSKKATASKTEKSNSSNSSNSSNNNSKSSTSSNSPSGTNSSKKSASSDKTTGSSTQQNCKTVHHDATGQNETVWVQDTAAWDEQVVEQEEYDEWIETSPACIMLVCNGCGAEFANLDELSAHRGIYSSQGDWSHSGYHDEYKQASGYYIHHNAVTNTVHHDATGHNETKWVQDVAAWDEQVCN